MSSDGSKRKSQEDEIELIGTDSSNIDSQKQIDTIQKKKKIQNKIKCQKYRDKKKKEAINLKKSNYQTITIEEQEKIKRRQEQNREKCRLYREKKKKLNELKCSNHHNSQIPDSSTIHMPYISPIYTDIPHVKNEIYIPESHSNYDDTLSEANYVPQLHELNISEHQTKTAKKRETMELHQKSKNREKCRRYREKMRKLKCSNHKTLTAEEQEKIKLRQEKNKERCKRYRDEKRTTKSINLESNREKCRRYREKKRKWKELKCSNHHNSQIPGQSASIHVPYVPDQSPFQKLYNDPNAKINDDLLSSSTVPFKGCNEETEDNKMKNNSNQFPSFHAVYLNETDGNYLEGTMKENREDETEIHHQISEFKQQKDLTNIVKEELIIKSEYDDENNDYNTSNSVDEYSIMNIDGVEYVKQDPE